MKRTLIKFRCTVYQKKLLQVKAKHAGLSLSGFCRETLMGKDIKERLSEEHIDIYRMLVTYHNNFKRIANMYKKSNPRLAGEVVRTADEIKKHLKKMSS